MKTFSISLPAFLLSLFLLGSGCEPGASREAVSTGTVVVYSSVDDVFARPVCEKFQRESGIQVKLVPDTEETKSTGLLNRLIAEKDRPQADVFWSGDPVRAAILKRRGISAPFAPSDPADTLGRFSDPERHWSALSARARVIIVNTNLVAPADIPRSIQSFVDPEWKGKGCMANPLFGTTSMHAAALFESWGEERARKFFDSLEKNEIAMLSSNGEVKRRVAAGDFAFGLTDTDDASVAVKEGKPVAVVFPDQDGDGALIVPNAAVLIANAPHPGNAEKFIEFLLRPDAEMMLAESEAAQMPLRPGVAIPDGVMRLESLRTMKVDYSALGQRLEQLSSGFLKDWVNRNLIK